MTDTGKSARIRFLTAVAVGWSFCAFSAAENDGFNDGIDRSDPNFVKASLVVVSPGNELLTCMGHIAIRLECETFQLDNCFSYESERVLDKVFTYFAGKLKMGMFAVDAKEYLGLYAGEGRGVWLYPLNLPPAVKQRLWKIMDDLVGEGPNVPYDYDKRGCVKAAWRCILEALGMTEQDAAMWCHTPPTTQRERTSDVLKKTYPWNRFFLHAMVGTEVDDVDDVVVPNDIVAALSALKVDGVPVLAGGPVELYPLRRTDLDPAFTPLVAAGIVAALLAALCFVKNKWVDFAVVALHSALGLVFAYMFAALCLTKGSWNLLALPFNPLPVLCWKWRRKWALPFAGFLLAWEAFMVLYPHQLTDPAFLVLVVGLIVFYLKIGIINLKGKGVVR